MNLKEKIIKDLSIKYNLSEKRIELIINHVFKFIMNKMADDEYKTIMIHHFGKFTVKKQRANFWKTLIHDSTRLTKDQRAYLSTLPNYKDRSVKYQEFIQFNKEQKSIRLREARESNEQRDDM